jgi:hypothetical protein
MGRGAGDSFAPHFEAQQRKAEVDTHSEVMGTFVPEGGRTYRQERYIRTESTLMLAKAQETRLPHGPRYERGFEPAVFDDARS